MAQPRGHIRCFHSWLFLESEVGVPHRLQFSLLEPGVHFFSLLMADDINYQTAGAEAVFNVVVQLFFIRWQASTSLGRNAAEER